MDEVPYPRLDRVIIQVRTVNVRGRLYMPQSSIEGKEFIVVAAGPKVEDLKQGDKVLVAGELGKDYAYLPNRPDLFICSQSNVLLIYREEPDEPEEMKKREK